ncbi:hypothetical protein B808_497 [Fructilactobacillus florum 8D]|uniref:UPF0346 protein B808_497 n=2 Tax=Fructilactobacillus florum TaxID=640331 RepID=W9EHX9_9LACO|nr:YozE family protein [Fructilactobacillus florum]EKK21150.1 hypothetical protein B807_22 [Fructilactobacillus florum 2F]ETO40595.1 hypothetical protein B808_497 [Fructilactobacillus florum 8D]KRM91455.1 hypothetical protein FC87_GL000966 [Fructilactobacillus florum DSM 22689 = JCM 16035]
MQTSFYDYLMTRRNPLDHGAVAEFANNAFFDQSFPKHTNDFATLSQYLEENAGYLPTMTIFDAAWQQYLAAMN